MTTMMLSRRSSGRAKRWSWLVSLALAFLLSAMMVPVTASADSSSPAVPDNDGAAAPVKPLVLAHFYIWFTPGSWNRAKKDIPLAGRYSSDDADVMRDQVRQAKAAGIDGFIVSWKSTSLLNDRLAKLVQIAREADFKLAITYQGLDFNRAALPPERIATDLDFFADNYATNPVFDIYGKPMVVLTGTPIMTKATIVRAFGDSRKRLLVLASDKQVDDYERIADLVDGNLYYWSSVNPQTNPTHAEKLIAMGAAVRRHHGIWIAPVAPGFDARMVGGRTVVDRLDGETLRTEWAAAEQSGPSAIGIISWNEYSENTFVEPSKALGGRYLDVVAELTGSATTDSEAVDSSEPSGQGGPARAILALGGLVALFVVSVVILIRRQRLTLGPQRQVAQ